jgi:hypothetical protein
MENLMEEEVDTGSSLGSDSERLRFVVVVDDLSGAWPSFEDVSTA